MEQRGVGRAPREQRTERGGLLTIRSTRTPSHTRPEEAHDWKRGSGGWFVNGGSIYDVENDRSKEQETTVTVWRDGTKRSLGVVKTVTFSSHEGSGEWSNNTDPRYIPHHRFARSGRSIHF